MRLTCLKCGHQMDVATGSRNLRINCVCGKDYSQPEVLNTGTAPSEAAAERSRSRAFRAAGVVKNIGGFALGISLLGILFFPIALLGAGVGIYTLTMIRGPLGRYSGRRAAVAAVTVGALVFLGEGALAIHWVKARQLQAMRAVQASVSEDLRALLRAERLFRATHDTYGTFDEFRFRPTSGRYTIYLAPDQVSPGTRNDETLTDPLPEGLQPAVSESAFTAFAVANLDTDIFLDVWRLTDDGIIQQIRDDTVNQEVWPEPAAKEGALPASSPEASAVPTAEPGPAPSPEASPAKSAAPSPEPSPAKSAAPSPEPSPAKSAAPSPEPSRAKSVAPSPEPSRAKSVAPRLPPTPEPDRAKSPEAKPESKSLPAPARFSPARVPEKSRAREAGEGQPSEETIIFGGPATEPPPSAPPAEGSAP